MAIDYRLAIFTRQAAEGTKCDGEIRAAALDERLSRSGATPIVVQLSWPETQLRRSEGTLTLEAIQVQSIEAFLREQVMVRKAVEETMTEARRSWLRQDRGSAAEMWSETAFCHLYLPNRELIAIEGGGPQTTSAYSVVFDVAWDDEHGTRALKFRDGEQIGFGLAGD